MLVFSPDDGQAKVCGGDSDWTAGLRTTLEADAKDGIARVTAQDRGLEGIVDRERNVMPKTAN